MTSTLFKNLLLGFSIMFCAALPQDYSVDEVVPEVGNTIGATSDDEPSPDDINAATDVLHHVARALRKNRVAKSQSVTPAVLLSDNSPSLRGFSLVLEAAPGNTTFNTLEPFFVVAKLKNSGQSADVIVYDSPFNPDGIQSNIFVTDCSTPTGFPFNGAFTQPASLDPVYLGVQIETFNAAIPPTHLRKVEAGGEIVEEFDLSRYLRFRTSEQCDVSLQFDLSLVDPESTDSATTQENALQMVIQSNQLNLTPGETSHLRTAELELLGRTAAQAAERAAEGTDQSVLLQTASSGSPAASNPEAYSGCSATQQATINAATAKAKLMADNALNLIMRRSQQSEWTGWFGSSNPIWAEDVTLGMTRVSAILGTGKWTAACDGSSCASNIYAYVYPSITSDHKTYLCDVFWNAPSQRARDSQPGTIIHELAHFIDIHAADDYAYGTTNMEALALSNYAQARKNADSMEAYTEDQNLPFQNQNGQALPPAPPAPAIPAPAPPAPNPFVSDASSRRRRGTPSDASSRRRGSSSTAAPTHAPTSAPTDPTNTIAQSIALVGVESSSLSSSALQSAIKSMYITQCIQSGFTCNNVQVTIGTVASSPTPAPAPAPPTPGNSPTPQPTVGTSSACQAGDVALATAVNNYRVNRGLGALPISQYLTQTARAHVDHPYSGASSCNMHSWGAGTGYEACCYTSDHQNPNCMWQKVAQVSGVANVGHGYEVSAGTPSGGMDAIVAMWDDSSGHAPVIRTEGTWNFLNSGSIGCASGSQQSHCWFSPTIPGGMCSVGSEEELQVKSTGSSSTVSYSATFQNSISDAQKNLLVSNVNTAAQSSSSNLCSGQTSCSGSQVTQSASISTTVGGTNNQQSTDTKSNESGAACFGATNSVQSADGTSLLVSDVKVGMHLTTVAKDDEVWWVHRVSGQHKLLRLQLANSFLDVTPHHLVATSRGMHAAEHVKVGDSMYERSEDSVGLSQVVGIHQLSGAVAAPVTMSGKIVVNGVEASCYAMGNHEQLHQWLAPFRMLYKVSPRSAQALSSIGQLSMDFLSWVVPIEQYLSPMLAISVATAMSIPALTVVLGVHKLFALKTKSV